MSRLSQGNREVVALCANLEEELAQLPEDEEAEFRASLGAGEPGRDRVAEASYALLGLVSFLTVGPDEVRAWTVARQTPAQRAAGKVHSDIERGFIRAEVVTYDHLMAGGWSCPRPAKQATCAPRARPIPCRTATSSTSSSACDRRPRRSPCGKSKGERRGGPLWKGLPCIKNPSRSRTSVRPL